MSSFFVNDGSLVILNFLYKIGFIYYMDIIKTLKLSEIYRLTQSIPKPLGML